MSLDSLRAFSAINSYLMETIDFTNPFTSRSCCTS